MRGFDSCYPCIFNVTAYLKLRKSELKSVETRQKNKIQPTKSNHLAGKTLPKKYTTPVVKKVLNTNLRRLFFNKKKRFFVKKKQGFITPKQGKSLRKQYRFKFFKSKRLRMKTFFFKNVKTYSITKQNRKYSTTLRQNFRKKKVTRRQYSVKTRSSYLFSKVASVRTKALNFYTKAFTQDIRRLKSFIPLNSKTLHYKKHLLLKNTYMQFLRRMASTQFTNFNSNFKKKSSLLKKLAQKKHVLYSNSQLSNYLSTTLRKQKTRLKTSRLLRKRLTPSAMSGVRFKKYKTLSFLPNVEPQFLYHKGGLFNLNYFSLQSVTACGEVSTIQQYWTNLWLNTILNNWNFLTKMRIAVQPRSVHIKHNYSIFHNKTPYTAPSQFVLADGPTTIASTPNLHHALSKWLAPAIRYGDATFFKKPKTSLRQLKQHFKTKNNYVPINVSNLLDFKEKAVTEASFTRINSDDTIFADTEFANVISRLHKLPVAPIQPLHQSFFFKNTYPFYFFLNNNLNYLRSKHSTSYNVKQLNTDKQFRIQTTSSTLSKNLLFFLWKMKILKPKTSLKKFYKREIQKTKPRKSLHKFFNRLANKDRYRHFRARRFFTSFFNQQVSKWKTFTFSLKNTHFLKKRNLSNKLFSDRRYFKWALPIKKNQKFFKRLELKISKDLRRKQVLYSYFKNKHSIETRPISRTQKLSNFTKNSSVTGFRQKPFLVTPTQSTLLTLNATKLFTEPYSFHLDYVNLIFKNPFLLKTGLLSTGSTKTMLSLVNTKLLALNKYFSSKTLSSHKSLHTSNLIPHLSFTFSVSRKIFSFLAIKVLASRITPWYYNNIIRFIEDVTGRKVLFQFYPFMSQEVSKENVVRYKKWLPRMSYYERRLGHRFFLEESLHILHLGFSLKDAVLICSWLKSMILRISFWKTKFIFRFLKYLFQNYFKFIFDDLAVKGLKIKLKGKISVAGNSRKRTILYRVGSTSHSSLDLRVVNHFQTVNTFTGVMGLQVWVFY